MGAEVQTRPLPQENPAHRSAAPPIDAAAFRA